MNFHVISLATQFGGHERVTVQILQSLKESMGEDISIYFYGRESNPISDLGDGGGEFFTGRFGKIRRLAFYFSLFFYLKRKPGKIFLPIGYLGYLFDVFFLGVLFPNRLYVYCPIVDRFGSLGCSFSFIQDIFLSVLVKTIRAKWIFLTESQVNFFEKAYGRASCCFIPNISNLFPIQVNYSVRKAENLRVLVLGRFDVFQKGLDLLVEHLSANAEPVELHIVGDGEGKSYLQESLNAMKSSVSLLPWQDAKFLYENYDILLLPSRYEGVPLVVLEAISAKLPVVSSDLPGCRDLLPKEMMFPVGDLNTAFCIIRSLHDPEERKRIAENNFSKICALNKSMNYPNIVRKAFDLL